MLKASVSVRQCDALYYWKVLCFFDEVVQLQSLGLNCWFTCFSTCAAIHSWICLTHSWNSLPVGKRRKDLSKSFPNKGNIQLLLSWSVWFCPVLGWADSEQTGSPDATQTNKHRLTSCKEWQLSALSLGWSYCNPSAPVLLLLSLRHQYLNCNFGAFLKCWGRFSSEMDLSHITGTTSVVFPVERWPAQLLPSCPRLGLFSRFGRKLGIWDKSHTALVNPDHLYLDNPHLSIIFLHEM